MKPYRLNKFLALCGLGSRRTCDELIESGQITVNGEAVQEHGISVTTKDEVFLGSKKLSLPEKLVYYILNKPKGYLCSNNRRPGEKLAIDLIPSKERIFTVGRLDKNTTGLILLTNDGDFSQSITHPSNRVKKEYLVKTDKEINLRHLQKMSEGVRIDGNFVRPLKVKKVRRGTVKVILQEGKKHEVRKLVAAAGLKVLSLERIRIGGLHLGTMPLGKFKRLSTNEREAIFL